MLCKREKAGFWQEKKRKFCRRFLIWLFRFNIIFYFWAEKRHIEKRKINILLETRLASPTIKSTQENNMIEDCCPEGGKNKTKLRTRKSKSTKWNFQEFRIHQILIHSDTSKEKDNFALENDNTPSFHFISRFRVGHKY